MTNLKLKYIALGVCSMKEMATFLKKIREVANMKVNA